MLPSHHRSKGEGVGDTWVNIGQAKWLRLQQLDCHWAEVLTESRPRLLLLLVAPLWLLVILVITHWMHCSITYAIRISRQFSRDWPINRSPRVNCQFDSENTVLNQWSILYDSWDIWDCSIVDLDLGGHIACMICPLALNLKHDVCWFLSDV